jgi:hypothetical protein
VLGFGNEGVMVLRNVGILREVTEDLHDVAIWVYSKDDLERKEQLLCIWNVSGSYIDPYTGYSDRCVQNANEIYYQLVNTIVGNKELKEDT